MTQILSKEDKLCLSKEENHILSELVSVDLSFDSISRKVFPRCVVWKNRHYSISHIGLHHTYRRGRTLFHVFSVTTQTLFMRLVFNTDNLQWVLEQIEDNTN